MEFLTGRPFQLRPLLSPEFKSPLNASCWLGAHPEEGKLYASIGDGVSSLYVICDQAEGNTPLEGTVE